MNIEIDEGERQFILLSLGLCTLLRPGFEFAGRDLAEKLRGRKLFDEFRRLNEDIVDIHDEIFTVATVARIATDDPELLDWLLVAAGQTPEPAAGDFLRTLAKAALRADYENYELLRPALMQMKVKYPRHVRSAEQIVDDLGKKGLESL